MLILNRQMKKIRLYLGNQELCFQLCLEIFCNIYFSKLLKKLLALTDCYYICRHSFNENLLNVYLKDNVNVTNMKHNNFFLSYN